jgi:hypothetical protein
VVKDPGPRAAKIRDAVAAENDAWDRATERRADTEYALEQFEGSPEFDGTRERFDTLSKAPPQGSRRRTRGRARLA